jgi:predicted DNA-binding helix-hairpin-helix protein
VNVELPRERGLKELAPQKSLVTIRKAMAATRLNLEAARGEGRPASFAPAGQSTQMIVGADGAGDGEILARSAELYGAYKLRRVYYSAFSPIPDASALLPPAAPPLLRENRLYQADWLLRFYGFSLARSWRAPTRRACSTSGSTRSSPGRSGTGGASRST